MNEKLRGDEWRVEAGLRAQQTADESASDQLLGTPYESRSFAALRMTNFTVLLPSVSSVPPW